MRVARAISSFAAQLSALSHPPHPFTLRFILRHPPSQKIKSPHLSPHAPSLPLTRRCPPLSPSSAPPSAQGPPTATPPFYPRSGNSSLSIATSGPLPTTPAPSSAPASRTLPAKTPISSSSSNSAITRSPSSAVSMARTFHLLHISYAHPRLSQQPR